VCLARLSGDGLHSLCHLCDILCDLPEPIGARGVFDGEFLVQQAGPLMGHLWQSMTFSVS
jgi:hypothetical protein